MNVKKLLLGSTAILGAGAIALGAPGAAQAQDQADPGAVVGNAGPLQLSIKGFQNIRFHIGQDDNLNAAGGSGDRGYAFEQDTEVHFVLNGTHDPTGIKYGATIEMEADTDETANSDEVVMFFSGGFGRIELGDDDGPSDKMDFGAQTIAAGTGGIDGSARNIVAQVGNTNSGDSTKAVYYTPRIAGIQVGIGWTPDTGDFGRTISGDNNPSDFEKFFEGGVNWVGDLGPAELRLAATGGMAELENDTGFADDSDLTTWMLSGDVHFGIFSFAAAYGQEEFGTAGGKVDRDWYQGGVAAAIGPANVSLTGGQVDNDSGNDPYTIVLSGDVGLMPGVTLQGDVSYSDFDANFDVPDTPSDDQNTAGVIRLSLDF